MTHCKVRGCMARTDGSYAGLPACKQGFSGTPELVAATFKDCLLRGGDQLERDTRLLENDVALIKAVRAGCTAVDIHIVCSFPECKCAQMPKAIRAALLATSQLQL